ncbi:response regulator transcription factor [Ruania alba]|uniref:Response regulatory domain-containing protein n=1 Tax=Ruania alba TaxID=648782 RepID=A0A1H5FGE8_9MICO|nr:response regulator transcription factor [Ruania alba]SEE02481.1 hypothetical protein SAMN04488554_1333 [Ruania alba]
MTAVEHEEVAAAETESTVSVLLYSDDPATRAQVLTGVGRRASINSPRILWQEVATPAAVVDYVENGSYDLLILDGESAKFGGMGLCRSLKTEIYQCPPVLLLIARAQDAWLASWSEADAVVSMPLDPLELQETVADMLASS